MTQKQQVLDDMPHKSSLVLQILLYFNVYISTSWMAVYGYFMLCDMELSKFHNLYDYLEIIAYVACFVFEICRLYAGYSGNLRAKTGDLSIFLILTIFIQLPIFLLLSNVFRAQILLITIATVTNLVCMVMEFSSGVLMWRTLSQYQSEVYKLKRHLYLKKKRNLGDKKKF